MSPSQKSTIITNTCLTPQQYPPIHQTFTIPYSYPVYFTENIFAINNPLFKQCVSSLASSFPKKLLFIIDREVARNHPSLQKAISTYVKRNKKVMHMVCEPLIIPGGEAAKNTLRSVEKVLSAIEINGICRHKQKWVLD